MMREPLVFASREALYEAAALRLSEAMTQAITIRGAGCAALSGGTTPGPIYETLSAHRLDWRAVTFALTDERFVPPEHEASNEGLLRRTLAPALAAGAGLAPLYTPGVDLDIAAERADTAYASLGLDFVLLGMGADGHIASWFADAPEFEAALDPDNPRTVIAVRAPRAYGTPERLSLTAAAVVRAERVLLVLTGEEKRARFGAELARIGSPAATLFAACPRAPEVFWAR
jgi:6-phosphogluconolactonase